MSIRDRLKRIAQNDGHDEPKVIKGECTIQEDAAGEDNTSQIAPSPSSPQASPADDNPFAGGDDNEPTSIGAALVTIDPNPDRLSLIANNPSPRTTAVGKAVVFYEKSMGATELAVLDACIIDECLKAQIGGKGKDNRTAAFLKMLEAERAFEREQELTGNEKAFGKK